MLMRVVIMIMTIALVEQSRTGEIHHEADCCHHDRFGEVDRHWHDQTLERFPRDQKRDQPQYDGTRERREISDLSSSIGEPWVIPVPFRVGVRKSRDQESPCMS